jgi:LuxR family maltose regulon positive regulatory protein
VYREWNDMASVRLYAEKLIESSAMWGLAGGVAGGHLYLAMALQAQGEFPGANRAIADASQVMRQHPLELGTMPWIGATRARLWLAQGKLDDARQWADTRGLSAEGRFDLKHEVEYLTLVRILLAEGRVDEATRLLSRLQNAVESTGRYGNLVGVLVLRAMALDMQADTGSALALLEQAVRLAHSEGYIHVFVDGGKRIETLLRVAVSKWREPDLVAYADKLLAAFPDEAAPPTAGQAPQASILSERELEVLRLMAAGCSNQEIANELVIALGTAKRHTANIFDKLDVRNRTEAVAKARQLGLL